MKRGIGVGHIIQNKQKDEGMKAQGAALEASRLSQLKQCADTLRQKLAEYAAKHESEIRSNPELRKSFREMCDGLGVDMLSSQKSILAQTLGLGDFYYQLAVQAIEQCVLTRKQNGGTMPLDDLLQRLQRVRPKQTCITESDIVYALGKVQDCFGSGYVIKSYSGRKVVVLAGDREAGQDTAAVLNLAASVGYPAVVTVEGVVAHQKGLWSVDRAQRALDVLLWEGQAWIEERDGGAPPVYWFPCFMDLS